MGCLGTYFEPHPPGARLKLAGLAGLGFRTALDLRRIFISLSSAYGRSAAVEAIRSVDAHEPIKKIQKTSQAYFPPTKVKGGLGERVLGLHFYPAIILNSNSVQDLGGTRIFYSDIDTWLLTKQGKVFHDTLEDWVAFRRTTKIAAEGWTKYRSADTQDLEQYVDYTLLMNPKFDQHPAIQKILAETKDRPGAFGAAMENLATPLVEELRRNQPKASATGGTHG